MVREKPTMVNQQKRAKGLFFNLQLKFGHGKAQQQTIVGHPATFIVQEIIKDGTLFRIALCDEPHLATILCFDGGSGRLDRLLRMTRKEDQAVLCIYGGKVCPQYGHYHHHYPSVLDLNIIRPDAEFFRAFPFDEICAELGVTPENADTEEYRVSFKSNERMLLQRS